MPSRTRQTNLQVDKAARSTTSRTHGTQFDQRLPIARLSKWWKSKLQTTNNPRKIHGINGYKLDIIAREPIEMLPHPNNSHYLETKKNKLGHWLNLVPESNLSGSASHD